MVSEEVPSNPTAAKHFEMLVKHYENDLHLYWIRANFFLLVQGGLLAFVAQLLARQMHPSDVRALALFGALLGLLWFAVLLSSLAWIEEWRTQIVDSEHTLGSGVEPFTRVFRKPADWPRGRRMAHRCKPTVLALTAPLIFLAAWIYLLVGAG